MFLERRRYRLRRLTDAAYLLPLIGFILWALPAIRNPNMAAPRSTADGIIYLFLVWAGLILSALTLSLALRRAEKNLDRADANRRKGEDQ